MLTYQGEVGSAAAPQVGSRDFTSSRSCTSSSVDFLMRSLASLSSSSPVTTSQFLPSDLTGNPNCSPSGIPYSPWLTTASECQSPHGVGFQVLLTESSTALAAEAADDEPRASMTAAPRFCTVSMNLPLSQPWSLMTSNAGRPAILALRASGYCVVE